MHIFHSQFSIAFEGKKDASLFIPISLALDLILLVTILVTARLHYVLPQFGAPLLW